MAQKVDIGFFGGRGNVDRTSPEARRRDAMAEMIARSSQQPEGTEIVSGVAVQQSPIAGLAKALGMGVSGYQSAKAEQAEQARKDAARQTMAQAMEAYNRSQSGGQTQLADGDAINWNVTDPNRAGAMYADLLMQNEDTAPIGMQTQMGQMQTKMNNANELDMYKQKFPMELDLARAKAQIEAQYRPAPASIQEWEYGKDNPDFLKSSQGAGGSKVWEDAQQLVNASVAMGQPMDIMTAYGIAKSGLGVGRTITDGAVAPVAGATETAGAFKSAEAAGTEVGKVEAERSLAAPAAIQGGQELITLIDGLVSSPGLPYAVGKSSVLPIVPGTPAADFQARLDQVGGKQFLQAYQNLKGGGAITDLEGTKAGNAIARMQKSQTEAEFKAAAKEFQDIVKIGIERQKGYLPQQPNLSNPYATVNPAVSTPVDQIQPLLNADFTPEETKVIGGKTYVKSGGQWFEQ